MKVVVLYNAASQDASVEERDILAQRDAVLAALQTLGHDAVPLACTLDLGEAKARLTALSPAVAFNLVESLGGTDRLMPAATLLLEAIPLAYTGNSTGSILSTSNKLGAKERLRRAGLPTPDWWTDRRPETSRPRHIDGESRVRGREEDRGGEGARGRRAELQAARGGVDSLARSPEPGQGERYLQACDPGRVIVKAIWEHASFHMDDSAVVTLEPGVAIDDLLRSRVERTGRPHFAEEFIDGREFNLTLLAGSDGPEALPAAEIDFASYPDDKPRIVGYRAKWDEASFEFENTPRRFDFPSADRPLLDRLCDLAKRCWQVFGLSGYARVDFRVDRRGEPWILEVNANPCLAPDAGFAAAVERAGIGYDRAVARILDDALRRDD